MSDTVIDQIYSPHAEDALIGAALVDPGVMDMVDISPGDFRQSKLAAVWTALQALHQRGHTPDLITLGAELAARGELEYVGGEAYLTALIMSVPSSQHAEEYAAIIRDKAARRRIIALAQALATQAMRPDSNIEEDVSRVIADLAMSANANRGAVHWSHYLAIADQIVSERAANPRASWGIETGYDDYDLITGGLQPGEVLLVSAAPGVGKSIWTMQLAVQLAETESGAIYSLEMYGDAVAMRALSGDAGVATRKLKSGEGWTDLDWVAYYHSLERLHSLPVYMSDSETWTTSGLRADLSRLKRQYGIKWFVLDYDRLLNDGDGRLNENEKTQEISRRLKAICKSLKLAGIVIHSQNKVGIGNGSESNMANLSGSGQVSFDADIILLLSMPDKAQSNWIRFKFDKGRELDWQKKSFDLVRKPGLPWYVPADTINLQEATR